MLDHTGSYCDLAFENSWVEIERKWDPKLKVMEWNGKPDKGDKWLRGGLEDEEKFAVQGPMNVVGKGKGAGNP